MRNKPRRYRLKVEFIIALIVSGLIASFSLYIVGELLNTFIQESFNKQYDKAREELKIIFTDLEKFILDNDIQEEDYDRLEIEMEKYSKYTIDIYFFEKDITLGELTEDEEVNNWPYVFSRYIRSKNNTILLSGSIKSFEKYWAIISIVMLVIFLIVFVTVLTLFIGTKQKYLRKIANSLDILEGGNLEHKVPLKGNDEITSVAMHINQMSEALNKRIEKEKLVEQSKNELIANISHDLRTPLTSITGYLTLLKDNYDKNGEMNEKYLDICLNKSTALANLIEQLFEYVMLSNGQMKLNETEINMSTYIRQSIYEWESLLEDQQMDINFTIEDSQRTMRIDIDKFNRVLENLFKNIMKYAHEDKEVRLKAGWEHDRYIIELSNGIQDGIQLSETDIFNRFFTSDRAMESGGIGLTICKEIINMHQGQIDAHIENNRFTITIQLFLSK